MAISLAPWMHLCISLAIPHFANNARLSTSHQLTSRSLFNTTDAVTDSFDMILRDGPGPPLEGCQANFWDTTCCCFIDAGILKQDRCECTVDATKCEEKVRSSFHSKPSREIKSPTVMQWKTAQGYLKGFQSVQKEFCMAAPVAGPQIDSHERAYECTCSTTMGANVEMSCGSGCAVDNCKRWNPRKVDWAPFTSGRGECCLSSFTSATKGCQQEVKPITEDAAKVILSDALKHAARGEKKAFLISEHSVADMTKSFESAKEKKMSTSRSGAKFFFSGDYGYILKSIHLPEYEVLFQIRQPHKDPERKSLIQHLEWNRQRSSSLRDIDNCLSFYIAPENRNAAYGDAASLAKLIPESLKGKWEYNPLQAEYHGAHTFQHHRNIFKAVWCDAASEYRIVENIRQPLTGCEIENDPFYKWLFRNANENSQADALKVYSDFMEAFKVAPSATNEKKVGHVHCRCTEKWWPQSLINEFVLAFEYGSSTWMVVRNSVTAIRQDLARNGFTSFYKADDMFDVKPFPIHSDQRELLFGMQFSKAFMSQWRHWDSVRQNLLQDVHFMNNVLDNPMVDYSLLVSAFYIKDDERLVLDHVTLPNCVERPLARIATNGPHGDSDYGNAPGSILVCFSIIDMLMEFTFAKTPENLLLFNKWSDWGEKVINMFDCLGGPNRKHCEKYQSLRPKFRGVDIAHIETAAVQDVTNMMSADGDLKFIDPVAKVGYTYKCCCHSGRGTCKLYEKAAKSKSWLPFGSNPSGCGSLAGSGWHSYWREAGQCLISKREAADKRLQDMAITSGDFASGWI